MNKMTYKDIAELFSDRVLKVKMSIRVYYCKPYIRKAVDEWLKTGIGPDLTVALDCGGSDDVFYLSAQALIDLYGLQPLDALLFIDWADGTANDALAALSVLRSKSVIVPLEITEDIWEKLSPGVKEEYRKIERQKEADFLRLEAKYKEIENTQIYDGE